MYTLPFTLPVVFSKVARYIGVRPKQHPPVDYEQVLKDCVEEINRACKDIDRLNALARSQHCRLQRAAISEQFQQWEIDWLHAVIKAAGVNLSEYDNLRRRPTSQPPEQS